MNTELLNELTRNIDYSMKLYQLLLCASLPAIILITFIVLFIRDKRKANF